MNRRIVLIDRNETPNYLTYYGCGLGNEVYSLQEIEGWTEEQVASAFGMLGPGDGVMLVGGAPFNWLRQRYHFGVRSENYFDCSKLTRLSIDGGAFVKCIIDFPSPGTINYFMSEEFTKIVEFPDFKGWSIIHTIDEANQFLSWLEGLPKDTYFGFDYEGSGKPLDKWYELSGVSISTVHYAAFISLTDIRHQVGKDSPQYVALLKRLGEWLVERMDHNVTYNMAYEWQVSLRMLGVDLYNLMDASVVNVVDGEHMKKYSLKWTAQRVLGVEVWDTEFDKISDLIESMLFTVEGKLKAEKRRVLKVDQSNFEQTPEWATLTQRYPQYIDEFRSLILEYWGNEFMCIPSEILGKYCCLDAFYTLMIFLVKKDQYSEECWNVFMDNTRLGCRIMSGGLYIDEPFRARYEKYCHEQMAWGITYCALARCWKKMEKHRPKAANIKKYTPTALKLLEKGTFFSGDPVAITKYLLVENVDHMDAYPTGLDESKLLMDYGLDFANVFVELVKDAMKEVKMKGKIDDGIGRKKKIIGILAEKLTPVLGLDRIKNKDKHEELEKLMFYQRAYNELQKVSKNYLNDIMNIPETIHAFDQDMTLLEYSDFVSDNYFKCKSPEENDEFVYDFAQEYNYETAYLTAMMESVQQLPEAGKFYVSRGCQDINQGFQEFMTDWKARWDAANNGLPLPKSLYPDKVFDLALKYFQGFHDTTKVTKGGSKKLYYCEEKMKELWTDFAGFNVQTEFFPQYAGQFEGYAESFDPNKDLSDNFYFIRKMTLNYLLYKKYSKLCSVYVGSDGMFKKNNKYVIENEQHLPVREADPGEPGAIEKCFVKYEVNEKSSKRWSSAFHTIISHGDCKDVLCPPPSWDENGNIIYGGSDQMLTYFDISSAEVKAAGFASGDPDLIDKFQKGEDIYIYSAKLYLGEEEWGKLDKKAKKKWRKRFKTIFLGVLYGLGQQSLADRLECSVDEANQIIQGLYKSFPQLRTYVDSQGQYPLDNDGYINTMLGDKLRVREFYEFLPKAKNKWEEKNLIARIKRLGVNLPIQGGTSSIMACGFFNNIRQSVVEGWKQPLQPIIVVHDSNTNYIPVSKIFEIRKFYDKNYTEYCAGIGPKIVLLFDLLSGYSYETAKELKTVDQNTIQFSGDAYSLLKIYDKIMACPDLRVECSMTRDEIIGSMQLIQHPIDRFIRENGCNMTKDISNIKVEFRKL